MEKVTHVQHRPSRPVLFFDGDCGFCRFWVERWRSRVGDGVEFIPYQDPVRSDLYPELPAAQCEESVQYIDTDGRVATGAEAVFRALAQQPTLRWLLRWHQGTGWFRLGSERAYRFVAGHRAGFSLLTRLGWGTQSQPSRHATVTNLFLRGLGLVYLCAFLSLWPQVNGLMGTEGIAPAEYMMTFLEEQANRQEIGWTRFLRFPTLCWLGADNGSLQLLCALGTVAALALVSGIAPVWCLAFLWLDYLSLVIVGQVFLGFQWDNLLLETGWLAIFLAPKNGVLPWRGIGPGEPNRIALWLLRWLLFRLMFMSGCVKLLSGDTSWWQLTALTFHYETQPLPNGLAWYIHQAPPWIHSLSAAGLFFMELVLPFLMLAPRRLRFIAAGGLVGLQMVIALTGNYCFFNLLSALLCLTLLDDAALRALLPRRWRRNSDHSSVAGRNSSGFHVPALAAPEGGRPWAVRVGKCLVLLNAAVIVVLTLSQLAGMFWPGRNRPSPVNMLAAWVAPFRSVNAYGLFAVMTTTRPEIILEGSHDRRDWKAYEFPYKPGVLSRRPVQVAPHQPRLDWQMWFAALSRYEEQPWFVSFCLKILQGAPEVTGLLETNPFPDGPPRYIRAMLYRYRFTTPARRQATGQWWEREVLRVYMPPIALPRGQPAGP